MTVFRDVNGHLKAVFNMETVNNKITEKPLKSEVLNYDINS